LLCPGSNNRYTISICGAHGDILAAQNNRGIAASVKNFVKIAADLGVTTMIIRESLYTDKAVRKLDIPDPKKVDNYKYYNKIKNCMKIITNNDMRAFIIDNQNENYDDLDPNACIIVSSHDIVSKGQSDIVSNFQKYD
jgi:hypothetical protein